MESGRLGGMKVTLDDSATVCVCVCVECGSVESTDRGAESKTKNTSCVCARLCVRMCALTH